MDWNILRNYDQRKALWNRIQEIDAARHAAIDALMEQDEREQWSDERWNAEHKRIHEQFDSSPLFRRCWALEYKQSRNQWFIKYVESFGLCESKRITRKQAEIFARYSEPSHEPSRGTRGTEYYVRVKNLFIKTTLFTVHEPGYITIIEI